MTLLIPLPVRFYFASLSRRRLSNLFGQQAHLIHAAGAEIIHHIHDLSVRAAHRP